METEGLDSYAGRVEPIDSRKVLWASISALMESHWGKVNLTRLSSETGIGPGSCTRLKQQQTSVGLELIDKIAAHFNVQTWQLLVPGFDPKCPPTLMPVSEAERELYERLLQAAKAFKTLNP